jgi:heat shock protein HtpX
LHLTQGLLDLLEPRELEAVIAHVANRDAAVMTVVGGPGEALLSGGLRIAGHGWPIGVGGAIAALIGWIGTIGSRDPLRAQLGAGVWAARLKGSMSSRTQSSAAPAERSAPPAAAARAGSCGFEQGVCCLLSRT